VSATTWPQRSRKIDDRWNIAKISGSGDGVAIGRRSRDRKVDVGSVKQETERLGRWYWAWQVQSIPFQKYKRNIKCSKKKSENVCVLSCSCLTICARKAQRIAVATNTEIVRKRTSSSLKHERTFATLFR